MPKYEPSDSMGEHHKYEEAERKPAAGSGGGKMDYGEEYNKAGKKEKGGGYYMKGDKLYKRGMSYKKSEDLSTDDLEKSLQQLEEFAVADDAPTRKQQLLSKAMESDLDVNENDELIQLMGGETLAKADPTPAEEITKSLTDNEPLQKALDVSDYLREQHDSLTKSLGAIGDELQKSDNRRHDFSIILAKAVRDIGELSKNTHEVVMALAGQPARGPISRGVNAPQAQPLQKGFGGQPPAEEQLNKSSIFDALDGLFEESMEKGMDGRLVGGNGEDLSREIAKFEGSGTLSPRVFEAVQRWNASKTQAAH